MSKIKIGLLSFVILLLLYLFIKTQSQASQQKCIEQFLQNNEIYTVSVENKNKQLALLGSALELEKEELLNYTKNKCLLTDFIDNIETFKNLYPSKAWLNFTVDNYNNTLTIEGVLPSLLEKKHLKQLFLAHFPNKKISTKLSIQYNLEKTQFEEHLSFILASLGELQLLDITLTRHMVIIKGLARDNYRAQQTLNKLHTFFDGILKINNQIDSVVNTPIEFNPIEIEKMQPPKLEKPPSLKQEKEDIPN